MEWSVLYEDKMIQRDFYYLTLGERVSITQELNPVIHPIIQCPHFLKERNRYCDSLQRTRALTKKEKKKKRKEKKEKEKEENVSQNPISLYLKKIIE